MSTCAGACEVSFKLNGFPVLVKNASPLLSLCDWLHSQPGLRGTKRMCGEGGCGSCVVTAVNTQGEPFAINSVRTHTHTHVYMTTDEVNVLSL